MNKNISRVLIPETFLNNIYKKCPPSQPKTFVNNINNYEEQRFQYSPCYSSYE